MGAKKGSRKRDASRGARTSPHRFKTSLEEGAQVPVLTCLVRGGDFTFGARMSELDGDVELHIGKHLAHHQVIGLLAALHEHFVGLTAEDYAARKGTIEQLERVVERLLARPPKPTADKASSVRPRPRSPRPA